MTSPYAKTLRMVINDTLRYCNDYRGDGKDGRLWTWAECQDRANYVLMDMVRRTGILKATRTIPLQKDVSIYDLPLDCVRILRVGIHGIEGNVILPTTQAEMDLIRQPMSTKGDPFKFLRDIMAPNQICFYPIPYRDGSATSRDSDYGLLRQIKDADGNLLPFDGNLALRRVRGVPFARSGDGGIIREVISTYGNVQVTYIRNPAKWEDPEGYPDADIPVYTHYNLKHGIAERLLPTSRRKIHIIKYQRSKIKWAKVMADLQVYAERVGPLVGIEPV